MLKKVIHHTIIHSFESARKSALADVIYCCKMTSIMALDSLTSFLRLKKVTNIHVCKRMPHSPTIGGNYSVQWR